MPSELRRYYEGQEKSRKLDEFKRTLVQLKPVSQVCKELNVFLSELLGGVNTGIYLYDETQGSFAEWPNQNKSGPVFQLYDPFIVFLSEHDALFSRKDFEEPPEDWETISPYALDFFGKIQAQLVAPLILNQSLVGVLYAEKFDDKILTRQLFFLIEEVRSLGVMALSNAILYARLSGLLENLEGKVKERTKDLENAQATIVQSEKMAMLGVMTAGIAHEINTPSGVIDAGSGNIDKNIHYIFQHLSHISQLIYAERRDEFFRTIQNIMTISGTQFRSVKDSFKKKQELANYFSERGALEAKDVATFFVENGLYGGDDGMFSKDDLFGIQSRIFGKASGEEFTAIYKFLSECANCARNLGNIRYAIAAVTRIIKALKNYSRLDQGKSDLADVNEGLDNTIVIMASVMKGQVEIVRNFANLPKIQCYPDELNQVWTNLITNAYQAMKGVENPKITITTKLIERAGKQIVHISIADNGPGIPPKILGKIWDPFFTTKDQGEGSGLGLGIVRGIIMDKHQGHIEVQTREGQGCAFHVFLPVDTEERKETIERF